MFYKNIATYLYLTFCLNKKLQKFKTSNNLLQNYAFKNSTQYKSLRNIDLFTYLAYCLRNAVLLTQYPRYF